MKDGEQVIITCDNCGAQIAVRYNRGNTIPDNPDTIALCCEKPDYWL